MKNLKTNQFGDERGDAAGHARRCPATTFGPRRGPLNASVPPRGPMVRLAALACLAALAAYGKAEWTATVLHPAGAAHSWASGVHGGQQAGETADAAWNQRAALWSGTAASHVDLHPAGAAHSWASGIHGGQQAGATADAAWNQRAALWNGTAASHVDLHPAGAEASGASAVHGGVQAGSARFGGRWRAGIWSGAAGSWLDLHPPGAQTSRASAIHGGVQAGLTIDWSGNERAALWSGTAASHVDLHPSGAAHSWASGVHAGQQAGATADAAWNQRAALWSGTAASHVDLHPAGAEASRASAVHGGVQAGSARFAGRWRAGIWRGTAASWKALPMPPGSWGNAFVSGISGDGATIHVVGNAHSIDRLRTEALMWTWSPPAANVSGSLGLGGWMGPLTDPLVTFEVRAPGSTTALQTAVVGLSATGDFSFTTALPPGTYDVTAKSDRWLRARLQNVTFTAAGASGLAFGELIPGDVIENNAVDLADFLALAATYEVSPPAEARADLNGDGAVDLADFLLLAAHYETVGAP